MALDVNDIATDADLDSYLGGKLTMKVGLLPKAWDDAQPARQDALDRCVLSLARRTPPILEGDLADPTQLKRAVIYGACAHIYRLARTSGDGVTLFEAERRDFERMFHDEINGLQPTLVGGYRGGGLSISIGRR